MRFRSGPWDHRHATVLESTYDGRYRLRRSIIVDRDAHEFAASLSKLRHLRDRRLDVHKNNVPVPRDMLVVVDGTPEQWTVVEWQESQRGAQRASETDFGMMYGVCPNCSQRARIDRDTQDMECPECGRRSSIDWENLA